MVIARVAVENASFSFDRLFDYYVPAELVEKAAAGSRALVPFGSGNRKRQAVIFELAQSSDYETLKPVAQILDSEPPLNAEMLLLAGWLKRNCYCTLFDAAKAMLPTGLNIRLVCSYRAASDATLEKINDILTLSAAEHRMAEYLVSCQTTVERDRLIEVCGLSDDSIIPESLCKKGLAIRVDDAVRRVGDATVRMVRLSDSFEESHLSQLSKKQREVAELLIGAGSASVKELCYFTGVSQSVITALKKRGDVEYFDSEVYRAPKVSGICNTGCSDIRLTDEQQTAYENILKRYHSGEFSTTLLFGVTGSGKTSVFMKLIDDVVADGRGVIVMVPEIALTPQTLERFRSRYGDKTALFHSGLSLGQRMDEWKRVKNGDALIAIGTRSAVFAPFDDVGLIIMDEEQEYTYKSESSPRYHARDVARFRCAYHKCVLLLCSATPAIESYYYAANGLYSLETLTTRYGDAKLPVVDTVDVSEQRMGGCVLSPQLRDAIEFNLEHGYQSILLHNRRGYNTFVACRSCGHVLCCDNCSVSMTYHSDNGRLMCHYCGKSAPFATTCPKCGSEQLRYAGHGTQHAEKELELMFPHARILRMDADSTMSRFSHTDKLAAFARGDYDIMIGTQMVAKGLDFARVTLVGVLLADQMLYSNDFRSFERAFSLLTQVVGRAGRGQFSGRAIIQTLSPDNPVFEMAARQDYLEFYSNEIKLRRAMLYPPFSDICVVGFISEHEHTARDMSLCFTDMLTKLAKAEYPELPMRVLGPSPAAVNKVMGKFRFRLIIKCRNSRRFSEFMTRLLEEINRMKNFKEAQAFADMNPDNVL